MCLVVLPCQCHTFYTSLPLMAPTLRNLELHYCPSSIFLFDLTKSFEIHKDSIRTPTLSPFIPFTRLRIRAVSVERCNVAWNVRKRDLGKRICYAVHVVNLSRFLCFSCQVQHTQPRLASPHHTFGCCLSGSLTGGSTVSIISRLEKD